MALPCLPLDRSAGPRGTTMLAPVRVYLCRHAKAAPGAPDDLRQLTGKGLRQAAALGERLAALADPPVLVLSSPLVRARQTAEAIASSTGAPLEIESRRAPGATIHELREAVAGPARPVATVGQHPDCAQNAVGVPGSDPGFSPGAMAPLELEPSS